MKRFTLSMSLAGLLALAVAGGAQAAEFHVYAGTGATNTTTSTYGIGSTTLLGQGPSLGALINQKSIQSSGMVSGFLPSNNGCAARSGWWTFLAA